MININFVKDEFFANNFDSRQNSVILDPYCNKFDQYFEINELEIEKNYFI